MTVIKSLIPRLAFQCRFEGVSGMTWVAYNYTIILIYLAVTIIKPQLPKVLRRIPDPPQRREFVLLGGDTRQ